MKSNSEDMGVEMANDGEVMQTGIRFQREKNGETAEGNGLAVHLSVRFVRLLYIYMGVEFFFLADDHELYSSF